MPFDLSSASCSVVTPTLPSTSAVWAASAGGGAVIAPGSNPLMDVTVTASDDVRVKAVRLLAKINSQWTEIGPLVTQPFSPGTYDWDVDLCAVGPLNGALEVALKVWDHEGNVRAPLSARTIQVETDNISVKVQIMFCSGRARKHCLNCWTCFQASQIGALKRF